MQISKLLYQRTRQSPCFWRALCADLLKLKTCTWDLVADQSERVSGSTLQEYWKKSFIRLQRMKRKAQDIASDDHFISNDMRGGKYSRWAATHMTAQWIFGFLVSLGTLMSVDNALVCDDLSSPVSFDAEDAAAIHRVLSSTDEPVPSSSIPPEAILLGNGAPATLEDLIFWAEAFKRSDVLGLVWQV